MEIIELHCFLWFYMKGVRGGCWGGGVERGLKDGGGYLNPDGASLPEVAVSAVAYWF